jgi:meso-butanediol dehydrogenase/(S,S)-butanediol dehydrogenase/diacetyl reductase
VLRSRNSLCQDECQCGVRTNHGRFSGSTALVTGAGHGIGRACARRLGSEVTRVVVADLDLDAARKVEAGLPDGSGRHLALMMDVTNRSSVDEAVAQAVDEFRGLDVVVNVAGETPRTVSSRKPVTIYGSGYWS